MSTPTWPAWGIGVAGLALAGVSLAAARAIGAARSRWGALAGRVDDLAGRLRAVEARADRAHPSPSGAPSPLPDRSPSGPLPPCGGGSGWGVTPGHGPLQSTMSNPSPHPNPPPQGGRGPKKQHRTPPPAPPLILVPSLETTGSPEAADEAVAGLGRRFGAIWAMADAGEAPPAIARATGHPVGQVELILGLRRPAPVGESDADA